MSVAAYRSKYDQIAHDHVNHWRAHGDNPFQDPVQLRLNERETLRLIRKYAPHGSILDVGCGMGDLLLHFRKRERRGVDISEEYLKIARDRGIPVTLAEAEDLPFLDGGFDVVVATDILEHVFDLNQVVRELVRVTSDLIIVRVPNMENVCWACPPYGFVHVRIFDEGTLRLLFDPISGCEVLECGALGGVLHLVARK